MRINNGSLTIVLLGDWNRLYSQPEWIAQHIFQEQEIEIAVNGQGTVFNVSYRKGDVIITPAQDKVVFAAMNLLESTLESISSYVSNYLTRAVTPVLTAYGFNIDFADTDASIFSEVIDGMADANTLIESGYSIASTKISRSLEKEGRLINIDFNVENGQLLIHFNEHYADPGLNPIIEYTSLNAFIERCTQIVNALGYEIEGDEE